MAKNEPEEEKLAIFFELRGAQVTRFKNYKTDANLQSNAEVARKLMLDQLSQVEAAKGKQSRPGA